MYVFSVVNAQCLIMAILHLYGTECFPAALVIISHRYELNVLCIILCIILCIRGNKHIGR